MHESERVTDPANDEVVTVRTFISESEADIAKAALEAFGIECMFSRDDCGGQRPHLVIGTGIRLLVRSEDAERAEEVLANRGEESE
jgi:hypothetical protein